jgi:hypothetical protein
MPFPRLELGLLREQVDVVDLAIGCAEKHATRVLHAGEREEDLFAAGLSLASFKFFGKGMIL